MFLPIIGKPVILVGIAILPPWGELEEGFSLPLGGARGGLYFYELSSTNFLKVFSAFPLSILSRAISMHSSIDFLPFS